ncbi:proline-rich protein PRCC isoform X1 [Tenebrio molitor]|uniref:proline-rich protein PRCC isoform X1 n=2 Tax=Tenebrio molitor TaxID=7067 RepID=UPI003624822E
MLSVHCLRNQMALVAYDYDSGSENEEDEVSTSAAVIINTEDASKDKKKVEETITVNQSSEEVNNGNDVPQILSQLPESKSSTANIVEEKIEDFIPKYRPATETKEKKPQKTKILIPSLSEFEDEEDEPEPKKRKTSIKSSGLLSILPPVKGSPLSTKSFIPNVLKNKPQISEKSKKLLPNAVRQKAEQAKTAAIKKIIRTTEHGNDAESDDDIEVPETFDDEMWQKVCGRRTKPKPQVIQAIEEVAREPMVNIAPEPVKPYDGLDNAAFKELVGKSKRPVNIKLIDINEEEIIPDKDVWLTKSLTDPDTAPKAAVENPVDPTRKKKHHITYLAEQAKANEQELQSQWSASKHTRNQTRAKYGF